MNLICFATMQKKFISKGAIELGAVWLHSIHSSNIIQYHQKSHDCKDRTASGFLSLPRLFLQIAAIPN